MGGWVVASPRWWGRMQVMEVRLGLKTVDGVDLAVVAWFVRAYEG